MRTLIGNDVWIGANVVIRRGVTVGDGAIIGAGAVVVKDVKPYEIVGGVPARHMRFRFDETTIARLLALQWWNYDLSSPALDGVDFSDIHQSLALVESLVAAGTLDRLQPPVQEFSPASGRDKPPATLNDLAIEHARFEGQLAAERAIRQHIEAKLEAEVARRIELQLGLQAAENELRAVQEASAATKATSAALQVRNAELEQELADQRRKLDDARMAALAALAAERQATDLMGQPEQDLAAQRRQLDGAATAAFAAEQQAAARSGQLEQNLGEAKRRRNKR